MQLELGGHTPTQKFPAHLKFGLSSNTTWKFMVSKYDENRMFSQFLCTNDGFVGYIMFWNHSEAKNQFFGILGFYSINIGGHGFWDKGGVYTGVCLKKFLRPPSAAKIFFPPGCEIFFLWGVLLVDRGVILQKNDKK